MRIRIYTRAANRSLSLAALSDGVITKALDRVHARRAVRLDPVLAVLQARSLPHERW
jgi:hypothetical protein